MTYSLVARDEETGALGVAVQSHFFGVGALVTWAEAGVGAVATQSFVEPGYGPRGLELMRDGASAAEALDRLVAEDPMRESRQVAMVDATGRTAAYTGSGCAAEAGQVAGPGISAQANMMRSATVWPAMFDAFQTATGTFPERLLAALDRAEAEGGDIRGRQSAAILVVGAQRSDRPWEHVLVDLRVDDHPEPLAELRRLLEYHGAYGRLGRALFEPGAVIGDYALDDPVLDGLIGELDGAQEVLGDNPEPTFWQGVLLARAGRTDEARRRFAAAARQTPSLLEFARNLPRCGLLPDATAVPARDDGADVQHDHTGG
jgi:uncharacterized Ntn-hydrolase superfamily protein